MWDQYIQKTKDSQPRPLLKEALQYVKGKKVLDLGAGALNEARYLKNEGFIVTAVDSEPKSQALALEYDIPFVQSSFEDFPYDEAFDLVNAQYSIPFIARDAFSKTWSKIRGCLVKDGIFVGQFFGPKDDWKHLVQHSEKEVRELFEGMEILSFTEEEFDQERESGNKHWHVFHVIARKL